MCFSNLPLEFDEDGNPYLAEAADEVERPGEHDHGQDRGRDAAEADLDADPEGAYEAIVDSLPEAAREHVTGEHGPAPRPSDAESVGGD